MAIQRPESEARIASMFDRIAPRYDLLNRLLSLRQDQRWRRHLVGMIPYRPAGRYLDVATGTADVLLAAADARKEYASFTGVDISSAMLSRAAKKTAAAGVKAELKTMSAERLAFDAGTFDCLSISFGLRNVVDRKKALREFHRVLAPGGVLLILEFFIPRTGLLAVLFQLYFHKILPRIGALLSDKDAYKYLPESVGSFYTATDLRKVLYDVGFTVAAEKAFLFGACRLVKAVRT